jgi:hypothetical protein
VEGTGRLTLVASGVIRHRSKEGDARYGSLSRQLWFDLHNHYEWKLDTEAIALVEKPTFEDSWRGKELAKKVGGVENIKEEDVLIDSNLLKLFGAATICLGVIGLMTYPYAFITASQWKRNAEKPKICAVVEDKFPEKKGKWISEDEWEAVGIALWGILKKGEYVIHGTGDRS